MRNGETGGKKIREKIEPHSTATLSMQIDPEIDRPFQANLGRGEREMAVGEDREARGKEGKEVGRRVEQGRRCTWELRLTTTYKEEKSISK